MNEGVNRVAELAKELLEAKARVDEADKALKEAQDRYRRIERDDLPTLMSEYGFAELKLTDGTVVTIVDDVEASISEQRREAAHAWLVENGFSCLIKSNLELKFNREEMDEARLLAEKIEDMTGRQVDISEKVHPQTLKAFIKEQMAEGNTVPFDIFGIFPFSRAKLKTPR
jgi:hypothetical protein